MASQSDEFDGPSVAVHIVKNQNQRLIGACVHRKVHNEIVGESSQYSHREYAFELELFEFIDNEQYYNLDTLLNQIGNVVLYVSDEFQDITKGEGRKLHNLFSAKSLDETHIKKTCFTVRPETSVLLSKLVGETTHSVNIAETERPLAFGCLECLMKALRLKDEVQYHGGFDFRLSSLNTFMRLDSAASDAVNLFPKPDHPSEFGSVFGVLNRCKTKMGSRLLERWLRQPLLDLVEIERRMDVVEAFLHNTRTRNEIRDGPLKGMPDLDLVLTRMHKSSAGLNELYRLYLFAQSIPRLVCFLTEFIDDAKQKAKGTDEVDDMLSDLMEVEQGSAAQEKEPISSGEEPRVVKVLTEKFVNPLRIISGKFTNFERLIEHVMDLESLPEMRINPKHSEELSELDEERRQLEADADKIHSEARRTWGSFTDVKLEQNPQHGFILRTAKSDDERRLRSNNSDVQVLSILKNGVHFTTSALQKMGRRILEVQSEYKVTQNGLVTKAVETAVTYLPVVESVSALIAELDVLLAFSTAAAISPGEYVRPEMLPMGEGIFELKAARHPCVELMDDMTFLPNDYDLNRESSAFQLITGPNMGGKSTYIRGAGSIIVMAQVGMMVPCASARISIFDCVLARVGAGDAVQKGVSTFMAEMLESSVILEVATRNSFLIIDELGRGTSTFDGYGLAYAISDYIVTHVQCLCLFATHFHELTVLSEQHKNVVNKHVTAHVDKNQVVMLYHLEDGPCLESFGIHVAKMAGFPEKVLEVARDKARELEKADYFKDVTIGIDEQKGALMDDDDEEGDGNVENEEEDVVEEEEGGDIGGGGNDTDEIWERKLAALKEFGQLDVPNMSEEELQATLKRLFSRID